MSRPQKCPVCGRYNSNDNVDRTRAIERTEPFRAEIWCEYCFLVEDNKKMRMALSQVNDLLAKARRLITSVSKEYRLKLFARNEVDQARAMLDQILRDKIIE